MRGVLAGTACALMVAAIIAWGHKGTAPTPVFARDPQPAATATGFAALTPAPAPPAPPAPATPGVSVTPGVSAPSSTPPAAPPTRITQPPIPAGRAPMVNAATAAIRAWQQTNPSARTAAIAATCAPPLAVALATVDVAAVPAAPPAAGVVTIVADGLSQVAVTLADGTRLQVDLQLTRDRWLASAINPAT